MSARSLEIRVGDRVGSVSALLALPGSARALLVLGHGAGAGMTHPFLEAAAAALAAEGIGTLRYQFPYFERGTRRPDPRPVLLATVRGAVELAAREAGGLPLVAGGKSMGGRMTSLAAADEELTDVRGIVFFGFPLHAAGKPSGERGEHLRATALPLLFLQGTRDRLADLSLLRPLCTELGKRATLHVVDDADHSFHMTKRSGRTDEEVMEELAGVVSSWVSRAVA
ncbi:MAG: alpha/beta hydrolase family protein [Myxococcota bacterium]